MSIADREGDLFELYQEAYQTKKGNKAHWLIQASYDRRLVEKLQISDDERFRPCLALYMIIAWRILYITMLGREYPDVSCEIVFDKIEWQTAFIVLKHAKPPKDPPSLNEMIKLIASLGGFLNRSSDNAPGSGTLWKGVNSLYEYIKARESFELVFGHTYG